jgi:hypothetical protein
MHQENTPYYRGPRVQRLQRLPRPPTRYTFRASLLTSLSQAAQGKHFFPTYLFGLAMRPCHCSDLQHDCAFSSTRNSLAMHFRRCHFSGPYICSLTDTSLPRSSLSICLPILAWHAILPRPVVCSLQSSRPVPKCSVAASPACQGIRGDLCYPWLSHQFISFPDQQDYHRVLETTTCNYYAATPNPISLGHCCHRHARSRRKSFVWGLSTANWKVSSRDISYTKIGDSIVD